MNLSVEIPIIHKLNLWCGTTNRIGIVSRYVLRCIKLQLFFFRVDKCSFGNSEFNSGVSFTSVHGSYTGLCHHEALAIISIDRHTLGARMRVSAQGTGMESPYKKMLISSRRPTRPPGHVFRSYSERR